MISQAELLKESIDIKCQKMKLKESRGEILESVLLLVPISKSEMHFSPSSHMTRSGSNLVTSPRQVRHVSYSIGMTQSYAQHSLLHIITSYMIPILSSLPRSRNDSLNSMMLLMIYSTRQRLLAECISLRMHRRDGLSFQPIDSCPVYSRSCSTM